MGVVERPDSKYWWMNLERRGQRPLRRSTHVLRHGATTEQTKENRRLADAAYHAAMADLAKGRLGLTKPAAAPTLRSFLETRYRAWVTSEHGDSAGETLRRLDELFLPIFGALALDAIRPAAVMTWRTDRLKAGVKAQTVDRDLNPLRGLLTKAVEWDILDAHPLAKLRLKPTESPQVVRYLRADEEQRLLAALAARDVEAAAARDRFNHWRQARKKPALPALDGYSDHLTPLVIVALHTGLRRGELFSLQWRDLDLAAAVLTVQARHAKSKRGRRIPLNASAVAALRAWQPPKAKRTAYVFPGPHGKRLTNVQTSWETVLEAAHVVDFRFHDLRHTFASKLVQRGVPLLVVSQLLGHSLLTTTMRYAHLAPNQGREAVAMLV